MDSGVNRVAVQPLGKIASTSTMALSTAARRHIITHVLLSHTKWSLGVVFSRDGQPSLRLPGDNTIRLWQLNGRSCYVLWHGHADEVNGIAIGPDGQTIVSGFWRQDRENLAARRLYTMTGLVLMLARLQPPWSDHRLNFWRQNDQALALDGTLLRTLLDILVALAALHLAPR